jgi:hypothetical protein
MDSKGAVIMPPSMIGTSPAMITATVEEFSSHHTQGDRADRGKVRRQRLCVSARSARDVP